MMGTVQHAAVTAPTVPKTVKSQDFPAVDHIAPLLLKTVTLSRVISNNKGVRLFAVRAGLKLRAGETISRQLTNCVRPTFILIRHITSVSLLKAVGLLIFQKPSFKSRSRQVYVLPGF